jgi:RNA polymerase sigma-70 factor (ECF subfamily)
MSLFHAPFARPAYRAWRVAIGLGKFVDSDLAGFLHEPAMIDDHTAAVVERWLKAARQARLSTVCEFFTLSGQHIHWGLNNLDRRSNRQPGAVALYEDLVVTAALGGSTLGPDGRRLEAIADLPDDEHEVFVPVRIQGITQSDVAEVLGVSSRTVQRWLNRRLLLLTQ